MKKLTVIQTLPALNAGGVSSVAHSKLVGLWWQQDIAQLLFLMVVVWLLN
jgi:hypothetical protein